MIFTRIWSPEFTWKWKPGFLIVYPTRGNWNWMKRLSGNFISTEFSYFLKDKTDALSQKMTRRKRWNFSACHDFLPLSNRGWSSLNDVALKRILRQDAVMWQQERAPSATKTLYASMRSPMTPIYSYNYTHVARLALPQFISLHGFESNRGEKLSKFCEASPEIRWPWK